MNNQRAIDTLNKSNLIVIAGGGGFIGGALAFDTAGSANTTFGGVTLRKNTSGVKNTAVGYCALYNNTGEFRAALGYTTDDAFDGYDNTTALGVSTKLKLHE